MNDNQDIFEEAKTQKRTAFNFGFYWSHYDQLFQQIQSECQEIKEAIDDPNLRDQLQDEIGDLMHVATSLCLFCGFDPKETFQKSLSKFQRRFDKLVELAKADGFETLKGQEDKILLSYWKKAKEITDAKD